MSKAKNLANIAKENSAGQGLKGLFKSGATNIPDIGDPVKTINEAFSIEDVSEPLQANTEVEKRPMKKTIKKEIKEKEYTNLVPNEHGGFDTRITLVMDEDLNRKMKLMSFHSRQTFKEIVNNAIRKEIDSYESKNGKLPPLPDNISIKNKARYS